MTGWMLVASRRRINEGEVPPDREEPHQVADKKVSL